MNANDARGLKRIQQFPKRDAVNSIIGIFFSIIAHEKKKQRTETILLFKFKYTTIGVKGIGLFSPQNPDTVLPFSEMQLQQVL